MRALCIPLPRAPLILLWTALTPVSSARAQDPTVEPFRNALREHARTFELRDGVLTGPGADLLLAEGRAAQFFLLGEQHGVAEIPALAGALFRDLSDHGYRHLAIETGDIVSAAMEAAAREPDPIAALTRFHRRHWPGAAFFTLRQEAELLVHAAAAVQGDDVLWGLDYDIFADRYSLRRLAELADTGPEREATRRAIAAADSALDRALAERNPRDIMMYGGPMEVLDALARAFQPEPGGEADRIISLLRETRAINAHWVAGRGWQSNHVRARWNKRQFGRLYYEVWERTGEPPRVMLKFGASHMLRGLNFTDVYDLGSMASELADALGGSSFHVMVLAGAGTTHAAMDPTVMRYREAPVRASAWTAPFHDLAATDSWTVYDLRPLRPAASAGTLGDLSERLEKIVWGFDAVVVLTGSGPSRELDIR